MAAIEGGFGEATVTPRDGERGTLILIDSSRATSGDPLVVMVNDQVISVPDEDGHIANETSGQPGARLTAPILVGHEPVSGKSAADGGSGNPPRMYWV